MAWKSPTEVNMSDGLSEFLPYLSDVTNFWFGRMLIIAVFVIFFVGYIRSREDDYVGGFAVASYVSFVISLFFWILNLISGVTFGIIVGLSVVSTLVLLFQRK